MSKLVSGAISLAAVLILAGVASAQYAQDFESLTGSAAGVPLTGQDGYYIPAATVSADFNVYTYAGNALGYASNPTGGSKFIAGVGPGGGTYCRAQRDVVFPFPAVRMSYDFCAQYLGQPGLAANNLGSISLQPFSTGYIIHLFAYVDPLDPSLGMTAGYMAYDVGGTQTPAPGAFPGAEWQNLELNHWYNSYMIWDADPTSPTFRNIFEVGITDLATNVTTVANPVDWYLEPSWDPFNPSNGFRFFAGGGNADNSMAFDNMLIDIFIVTPTEAVTWSRIKGHFK